MKRIMRQLILITFIFGMLFFFGANAGAMEKKIILFQDGISPNEIKTYIKDWKKAGAEVLGEVSFINGVVLNVPDTITSEDLADDERITSVQIDRQMGINLYDSNDYGISLDISDESGEIWNDVAGDEAANDEPIRFVTPLKDDSPFEEDRPWGILHLYDLFYDPEYMLSPFDNDDMPLIIGASMEAIYLKQINIAVFDTGVDYTHPILKLSVKGGADFVNMTHGIPMDDNGHGTHVTATIAAKQVGLASGSRLYAVKVLDENGMGDVSTLVLALQWAIDNEMDIANMSVAFRDDDPIVRLSIEKASETGLIMVAAVGNHSNWEEDAQSSGDGAAGDGAAGDGAAGDGAAGDGAAGDGAAGDGAAGADGTSENSYPVMYPAAYPQVIAVGAHTSYGEIALFSNTGPELDLNAPGKDIVSANATAVSLYGVGSGTSMATPHVTGSIALMLSLDHDNTLTSLDDIRDILITTSADGNLDLMNALEEVRMRQRYKTYPIASDLSVSALAR